MASVRRASRAAQIYSDRWGWNPLPTHRCLKRPIFAYERYWTQLCRLASWPFTPRLQLVCGVLWGLAVIDLDGEGGRQAWEALTAFRPVPATWVIRTPSGSSHLWFAVSGVPALPRRCLYEGGRHERIDLLGDRSLVMAPPSLDLKTGRRYEFVIGPRQMDRPAPLPEWIVAYAERNAPRPVANIPVNCTQRISVPHGPDYAWRDVLRVVPRKEAIAFGWGLRLTGRVTQAGWLECRSLWREDRQASAGFHPASGYYSEPGVCRLSLFELGVALGKYMTWQDACNDLGRKYLGRAA